MGKGDASLGTFPIDWIDLIDRAVLMAQKRLPPGARISRRSFIIDVCRREADAILDAETAERRKQQQSDPARTFPLTTRSTQRTHAQPTQKETPF